MVFISSIGAFQPAQVNMFTPWLKWKGQLYYTKSSFNIVINKYLSEQALTVRLQTIVWPHVFYFFSCQFMSFHYVK